MGNEVVNQGRKQTAGGGRGLWIVLGILCVVIVGLVVGIVVVSLNSGRSQDTQVTENSEEMSEEQIEAQNYKDSFDKVRAEAKKLLAENPVDSTKIISLYSPYIEKSLADTATGDLKLYVAIEYANYIYQTYTDLNRAIDILDAVANLVNISNEEDYYNTLYSIYLAAGDTETANHYQQIISEKAAAKATEKEPGT